MNLFVFCDTELPPNSRYYLGVPFVQNGWRYATNGRIAVRMPCEEPDSVHPGAGKFPRMYLTFAGFRECSEPWPEWPKEQVVCRECGGTGRQSVMCPSCGERVEVPRGMPCIFCAGGKLLGPVGERREPRGVVVELAGRLLDRWYLALIRSQLTDLQYSPEGTKNDPLCFTAAGGVQGMLMPIDR